MDNLKYRVMVVDDEPDIINILQYILQTDFEVVSAVNGFDALEKIDRYQPDIIILDIFMPVIDGLQTCKAIRDNINFKDTPIIFLTADSSKDSVREAYISGANFYINKPFEADRLLTMINNEIKTSYKNPNPKKYTLTELAKIEMQLKKTQSVQITEQKENNIELENEIYDLEEQIQSDIEKIQKIGEPAPENFLKPRIIILDDDEDIVITVCHMLKDNYEIIPLIEPTEAMDKIVKWEPDICLLDVKMPKIDGFELFHLLSANVRLREIEFIFMSGIQSDAIRDTAFKLTKNNLLEKPFSQKKLEDCIKNALCHINYNIKTKSVEYKNVGKELLAQLEKFREIKINEKRKKFQEKHYKSIQDFLKQNS